MRTFRIRSFSRGARGLAAAAVAVPTAAAVLGAGAVARADTAATQAALHHLSAAEVRALLSGQAHSWVYLMNRKTDLVLGVSQSSQSAGAPVIQWYQRDHLQDQAWMFQPGLHGSGWMVLRNGGTTDQKSMQSKSNKIVQKTYAPAQSDDQWYPTVSSDGSVTFRNLATGRCLAIPGGNPAPVQAIDWACNAANDDQRWDLYTWA